MKGLVRPQPLPERCVRGSGSGHDQQAHITLCSRKSLPPGATSPQTDASVLEGAGRKPSGQRHFPNVRGRSGKSLLPQKRRACQETSVSCEGRGTVKAEGAWQRLDLGSWKEGGRVPPAGQAG